MKISTRFSDAIHLLAFIHIYKGKIPLRSYYCEFCKSYHLTSTPFYRTVRYDLEKEKPKEIY